MRRAIYASLFVAWGCGGDPAPQVEILEVTPTDIVTTVDARNDVKLRVRYFDDNGDLLTKSFYVFQVKEGKLEQIGLMKA